MNFLFIFFYFVLSLLFFLIGTKLILFKGKIANKFLGFQFLNLTLLIVVAYFSNERDLLAYPFLFKVTSPLVYLIYPFAFLFQEFMFFPEKKIKWYHGLHFLPCLLNFIEFLPIYLSSSAFKIELIKQAIVSKSLSITPSKYFYILDGRVHQILRLVQFLVYTILLNLRLKNFLMLDGIKKMYRNKILIRWLIGDIFLKYFTIILSGYYFFFPYLNDLKFNWQDILKIIDYVVLAFLLFYYPNLLNGIAFSGLNTLKPVSDSKHVVNPLYKVIERYFAVERCYLLENIGPQIVADKLNLSSRKVSNCIKECTNLSFPDYVNYWRLQYIEEQLLSNKQWLNYTFEAMALESGFGSRSNFYLAFKKIKKVSPTEYYSDFKAFHKLK